MNLTGEERYVAIVGVEARTQEGRVSLAAILVHQVLDRIEYPGDVIVCTAKAFVFQPALSLGVEQRLRFFAVDQEAGHLAVADLDLELIDEGSPATIIGYILARKDNVQIIVYRPLLGPQRTCSVQFFQGQRLAHVVSVVDAHREQAKDAQNHKDPEPATISFYFRHESNWEF